MEITIVLSVRLADVRIWLVCGEQALLVSAMRAAHENGFVAEAYGGTQRVALAGREALFAFFADIFFFCGVLCRKVDRDAEPEQNKRQAKSYDERYDRAHNSLLINKSGW